VTKPKTIRDAPSGGAGVLAVFCDLDEADRADFRPWLAEDMFPPRLRIGFVACASFDRVEMGAESADAAPMYLTLYDMPSLGRLYGAPYQSLRRDRDPRDAAFHERFRGPQRYTLAWTGPELSAGGGGFAEYVFAERFGLSEADIQPFNMWFAGAYLPGLQDLPGLRRVRRYMAMEGTPEHFVLHEFDDMSALSHSVWTGARAAGERSLARPAPGAPGLYRRVIDAP